MQHIAIIGAGMAGLAAAQRLTRRGIACTIYEQSRGVGGRVATRRVANCRIDHGAQVVKAPTPELRALVVASVDPNGAPAYTIDRPIWVFDCAGNLAEGDPEQNAEPMWGWRSGITALGKAMALGLDLRLETPVASIAQRESPAAYALFDDVGRVIGTASAVLFTPPAPQTAAILAASTIGEPLREALLAELGRASYRRCISVTFAYQQRLSPPWYALLNTDRQHPITWLACEHQKAGHAPPGLSLLTAQMSHDWSMAHWDTFNPEDVHQLIAKLIGPELDAPLWSDVQRWRYALPTSHADVARLNSTGSGLYFAGDYTTGLGRVHLAVESGWQVADLIVAEQLG